MRTSRRVIAALALALALTLGADAGAQTLPAPSAAPSASVVAFDEYRERVRRWHPVARQARLTSEAARAEEQAARGGFDPVVGATWERKTFGGTTYYDYASAKLVAPTPFGLDFTVGYERAIGAFASPDRRTPAAGLVTAGVSVPIGQRLLTDERRTAVAVARALSGAADAERDGALNRLMLQAARDYARWYEAWRREGVAAEGLALASFRLDAVRRRFAAGEAAAIDTIEAALELQRRLAARERATQGLYAARLLAEAHLWDERGHPAALGDDDVPVATIDAVDVARALAMGASAVTGHPDVRRAEERAAAAGAQRRLAAQGLLPAVELQASALAAPDGDPSPAPFPFDAASGDAKLAAGAKVPLLWLRERGRLGAATARAEQQRLEAARARREVAVQLRVAANDLATFDRLLVVQRLAIMQASALRDGEQRRFDAGESTLFLVNQRERVVLDEQLELAGLEARRMVAVVELETAVGARVR